MMRKPRTRKTTIPVDFYYKFINSDDELVVSVKVDLFDDGELFDVVSVEKMTMTNLYKVKYILPATGNIEFLVCHPSAQIIVQYEV